jgi:hypothetical protein
LLPLSGATDERNGDKKDKKRRSEKWVSPYVSV